MLFSCDLSVAWRRRRRKPQLSGRTSERCDDLLQRRTTVDLPTLQLHSARHRSKHYLRPYPSTSRTARLSRGRDLPASSWRGRRDVVVPWPGSAEVRVGQNGRWEVDLVAAVRPAAGATAGPHEAAVWWPRYQHTVAALRRPAHLLTVHSLAPTDCWLIKNSFVICYCVLQFKYRPTNTWEAKVIWQRPHRARCSYTLWQNLLAPATHWLAPRLNTMYRIPSHKSPARVGPPSV